MQRMAECPYHCNNGKVFLPALGLVPCPECAGKTPTKVTTEVKANNDYIMCDPDYKPVIGYNYDDEWQEADRSRYMNDTEKYVSKYDDIYKMLDIPENMRLGTGRTERFANTVMDENAITPETAVTLLQEMEKEAKKTGTGQNVVDVGYQMYDAFKNRCVYDDSIIMTFGDKSLTPLVYALQMNAVMSGMTVMPYISAQFLNKLRSQQPPDDPYEENQYADIPLSQLLAMDDVPAHVITKRMALGHTYTDYCLAQVVFIYVGPATQAIEYIALMDLLQERSLRHRPTYVIGSTVFTFVQNNALSSFSLNRLMGRGYEFLTKVMKADKSEDKNTQRTGAKETLAKFGR